MSSLSNDIGYTKLIESYIETDPNLLSVASELYTLPLKHQEWIKKEITNLEKAAIIQRRFSPYMSAIMMVSSKCPPGLPVKETKKTLY